MVRAGRRSACNQMELSGQSGGRMGGAGGEERLEEEEEEEEEEDGRVVGWRRRGW